MIDVSLLLYENFFNVAITLLKYFNRFSPKKKKEKNYKLLFVLKTYKICVFNKCVFVTYVVCIYLE